MEKCGVSLFLLAAFLAPQKSMAEEQLAKPQVPVAIVSSIHFQKNSDCYPEDLCKRLRVGKTMAVVGEIPAKKGGDHTLLLGWPAGEGEELVSVSEKFLRLTRAEDPRTVGQKQGMRILRGELPPERVAVPLITEAQSQNL